MGDFGEESDDSDGEGGMGNVNRLIMRPPGHSGKAKRGHLCFDASFETGNLGRVDLINEFEYDLFLRPDTCSPRLRFWFNFTVDNVREDQRVIFNIVNMSKRKNLYALNMTPIVKSSSRNKWQRIPKKYVFYQRSPVHKQNHILSFAFTFDKEDEVFQFAAAPPYSYSRLQTFLAVAESRVSKNIASFRREQIGESLQKRRVDMISVGKSSERKRNDKSEPETKKLTSEKRRVVVIMARIHPAETSASFVCQGLLELLISNHHIARELRDTVLFKVVPMVNPDGVYLGNYRSNLMGFDLNRSWHLASPFVHPTIKTVLDMIIEIDTNKAYQLDFVIDIHGHTSNSGCFIYGNSYEDVYSLTHYVIRACNEPVITKTSFFSSPLLPYIMYRDPDTEGPYPYPSGQGVPEYERHIVFPKILATVADDYNSSSSLFNADRNKMGTARRHLCTILNERVNCYSFEVSLFNYRRYGSGPYFTYDEDAYMRCGRNFLRALFEFYRTVGVVGDSGTFSGNIISAKQLRRQRNRSNRRNKKLVRRQQHGDVAARSAAPLHLHELRIDCSPSSGEEDRTGGRSDRYKAYTRAQMLPQLRPPIYVVLPEPSLSIIDFSDLVLHGPPNATPFTH